MATFHKWQCEAVASHHSGASYGYGNFDHIQGFVRVDAVASDLMSSRDPYCPICSAKFCIDRRILHLEEVSKIRERVL